jgi:hypothetical protein
MNKKNLLRLFVTIQPGRTSKTSKYKMITFKSVPLKWFKQKWALNMPIQCHVLSQNKIMNSHHRMDGLIDLKNVKDLTTGS